MKKRLVCLFTMMMAGVALLLGGCSDFDEMKSQRLLVNAKTLVEQGRLQESEQVLAELAARYPNTAAGQVARQHIARLQQQRTALARQQFGKILDSFQQVLNGYRAVYAEYPQSLDALDASGYFFDTAYLDEVVPEGYQVYLLLGSGGRSYRLWCVAANQAQGYVVDEHAQTLAAFDVAQTVSELQARFTFEPRGRRLVVLHEGSRSPE